MESLKDYIEREQAFKSLDMYLEALENTDEEILESIFNGRTNGKTIWQDMGGGLGRLFSKVGVLLGVGATKFFNWITGKNDERKERNNGIWPGFYRKNKEEIKHNNYNLEDIVVSDTDAEKIETILVQTDSKKSNSKTGFGDFENAMNSLIKEYNLDKDDFIYFYTIYKKKVADILALFIVCRRQIAKEHYLPVLCFKFANDIHDFNISLDKIFKRICIVLKNVYVKKYTRYGTFDKGLAFKFTDNLSEEFKTKNGLKLEDDFWILNFEKEENTKSEEKTTKESLNEELDAENLMWKLDKWFEDRAQERQIFYEMIAKYNQTVDVKILAKDIKDTKFEETLKEFVNFMYDDFDFSTEKDYLYQLKKIIEYIKGKKVDLN